MSSIDHDHAPGQITCSRCAGRSPGQDLLRDMGARFDSPEAYAAAVKWVDAMAHVHDLRIGAREYDGSRVKAWQVYCAICDASGRIVLPEAEAEETR